MNEEHRLVANTWRREARPRRNPAVAKATKGAAGMEQGESGKAETVVEFTLKLVAVACVGREQRRAIGLPAGRRKPAGQIFSGGPSAALSQSMTASAGLVSGLAR